MVKTQQRTPRAAGFSKPAEWAPHKGCWLAWPAHAELWEQYLQEAREEFVALCSTIADPFNERGAGSADTSGSADKTPVEQLEILVPDQEQELLARRAMPAINARFHHMAYGDIWLRDTGPIFVNSPDGKRAAVRFSFNGWGGKYLYPDDKTVSSDISSRSGLGQFVFDQVLEGGAIEVDGEGTCIASRDCLLSDTRNPGTGQQEMEEVLREALGVEKILWLSGCLNNDHTDGHVDTLARFISPGRVVCMKAIHQDDPNAVTLAAITEQLNGAVDARGRKLCLAHIPSPARVMGDDDRPLPASYLNFYIGNRCLLVPTFGSIYDRSAVERIAALFPSRRTVGLRANAILQGGGAFHCITLPQPL